MRKKIKQLVVALGFGLSLVATSLAGSGISNAATTNLIANPGFETPTSSAYTSPADWTSESWGTNNATFSYTTAAHSGTRAAETTVSNYQSGDAKWIFNPVNVTPGQQYQYSDWYHATATTQLWAQYKLSSGSLQYVWLGAVNPTTSWTESQINFTVPANVVNVSIFHLLNTNGSLTIDDTSLIQTSCPVSESTGVYNGGFEQTCPNDPTMPADWHTESYGSPDATYAYTTVAHSGSHSVKTTMQGTSGEAGWQTIWQPAASNQRYGLRFWQNGTAYVYAYVEVKLTNGNAQYISLMSVPSTQNTGWSNYSDNFVTPLNTQSLQITIATSEPGYFYLDDVALATLSNQSPINFNSGVVSMTFDDGDASTYSNGFLELKKLGLKGTFYINAGTLGTSGYMTRAQVHAIANAGDEIGSHEYQHLDMVKLTTTQLTSQITENNASLHSLLGSSYPLTDFASPYGSYTSSKLNTVMSYYHSHRTTDGQFNSKANLNARTLHAKLVTSSTTPAQVESWITQANQQHEWLILVYHAIGSSPLGGDGDGYATTPANFATEATYLKAQTGVKTLPVNAALPQLEAQE